jgi:hypothetical protein
VDSRFSRFSGLPYPLFVARAPAPAHFGFAIPPQLIKRHVGGATTAGILSRARPRASYRRTRILVCAGIPSLGRFPRTEGFWAAARNGHFVRFAPSAFADLPPRPAPLAARGSRQRAQARRVVRACGDGFQRPATPPRCGSGAQHSTISFCATCVTICRSLGAKRC